MARLKELDMRLHAIEDQLDDPKAKDWEEAATEREGDEVLEKLGKHVCLIFRALHHPRARWQPLPNLWL